MTQVALPRLLEADCSVAVTAASSAGGAGGTAALLRLRVEGAPTHATVVPAPRDVVMLLDRAALSGAVKAAAALRTRLAAVVEQQTRQ